MRRPSPTDHEICWSKWLAYQWNGESEYTLPDGSRADIICQDHIWEVEWVKKWKEAPGQALLYQALSGRSGGVVLLLRGKPTEQIYILRCAVACASAGLKLRTVYAGLLSG